MESGRVHVLEGRGGREARRERVEILKNGYRECRGLPNAGLSLRDDTVPLDDEDDSSLLNSRRTLGIGFAVRWRRRNIRTNTYPHAWTPRRSSGFRSIPVGLNLIFLEVLKLFGTAALRVEPYREQESGDRCLNLPCRELTSPDSY